ncbi:MAG: hypothetical protein F6J90_39790 [Moorea sp. SIOASIH]|nr:hypothetical protein [Moorena sp. SIOASIH]
MARSNLFVGVSALRIGITPQADQVAYRRIWPDLTLPARLWTGILSSSTCLKISYPSKAILKPNTRLKTKSLA